MRAFVRAVTAGAAVAAVGALLTGVAGADPKGDEVVLVCEGGVEFTVVVAGNGVWTPGHDVDSNAILHPVAFGEFHGTLRDAAGTIVDEFTDPAVSRGGGGHQGRDLVECTFSFTEVSDGSDPEFPAGFTFEGEGSVTGWVSPPR